MKSIAYVGDLVLTGDHIAEAVVDFATALARRGTSDSITIPAVNGGGLIISAQLLLGPSSQLVVEPVDSAYSDPDDPEVLADLRQRTAALGPQRAVPSVGEPASILDDYDDLGEFD
jgi:hypothetical protein